MPSPTGNGNVHFITFTPESGSSGSLDSDGSEARIHGLLTVRGGGTASFRRRAFGSKKNSSERSSSGLATPVVVSRGSSFEEETLAKSKVTIEEEDEESSVVVKYSEPVVEELEDEEEDDQGSKTVALLLEPPDVQVNEIPIDEKSRETSDALAKYKQQRPRRNILGRSIFEQLNWTLENDPSWLMLKSQNRTIGLYKMYGELGAGNFARVRLGLHMLTKEKVAIKIIDKSRIEQRFEKMLWREVACMDALSHTHLIRLFEVIESPTNVYLITEYAPGGDLYTKVTLVGKLCELEANAYYRQVLSAVHYMHSNGLIHRDIKAENILFSTSTVIKLADFGFSTVARRGQLLTTFCGSPPYAAPELFTDGSYEGPPVDIWALGILLYFMLNGVVPFHGNCISSLKKAILEGKYTIEEHMSKASLDLLDLILKQIPCKRPSVSTIIRHPWVRSGLGPRTLTTRSLSNASAVSSESNPYHRPKLQRQDSNLVFVRRESINLLLPSSQATVKNLPTVEQYVMGLLSDAEVQARGIMHEIGIDDAFLDMHRPRGVRSAISGIYRIVLHRIVEGRPWTPKDFVLPVQSGSKDSQQSLFFLTKTLLTRGKSRNAVSSSDDTNGKSGGGGDKKGQSASGGKSSKACAIL